MRFPCYDELCFVVHHRRRFSLESKINGMPTINIKEDCNGLQVSRRLKNSLDPVRLKIQNVDVIVLETYERGIAVRRILGWSLWGLWEGIPRGGTPPSFLVLLVVVVCRQLKKNNRYFHLLFFLRRKFFFATSESLNRLGASA